MVNHTSMLISNNISSLITIVNTGDKALVDEISRSLNIVFSEFDSDYSAIQTKINTHEISILYQTLFLRFDDLKIVEKDDKLNVFVRNKDKILKFNIHVKPLVNSTTYVFVLWLLCLNLFVITISVIFSKNQIRSILDLANAADQFGKGLKLKYDFKPTGASEIRLAGFAFIKMRERIENQVNKHTKMLAMISHDLRTPLTRLKLQLELLSLAENIDDMKDDIGSMQQMIDSYLDFARGELTEEAAKVDISKFVQDYSKNNHYKTLGIIKGKVEAELYANINVKNFTRVLDNIFSNSAKYAQKLKVSVYQDKVQQIINIDLEDDGSGVDDKEKEMILKPFYRSDASRHLGKEGNVGLGLAIAKEIIKEHGGSIKILNSQDIGGLMVRITLNLSV